MLWSRRPGLGWGRPEEWWVGGGPPGDGASLGRTSLQTGVGVEGEAESPGRHPEDLGALGGLGLMPVSVVCTWSWGDHPTQNMVPGPLLWDPLP